MSEQDKVNEREAAQGEQGQRLLAAGERLSMRIWEQEPPQAEPTVSTRDYETVGYVITGAAELDLDGAVTRLGPGDSWVVPAGARHSYRILEALTAVEATAPPTHHNNLDPEGN